MSSRLSKKMGISRRNFLAGGAATLAAPFVLRNAWASENKLRVLTWEGYAEAEWVKPFEEKHGASVSVTYVGSVDEMFAKMQGSKGSDFDVVSFDTSSFKRYIDNGLIQPIDMSKVKNASNLTSAFKDVPAVMRGEKQYGVSFSWGSLPLVYDKSQFSTAPDSWDVMWDSANAQQIIALDDANNSVTMAAIMLGYDTPFNLNDSQFEAVKQKLIEQKRLLLTYFAGFDEGINIFADSKIKAMFAMGEPTVAGLQKKGVDAAMVIPKEGAIGWLDCWEISAGAANTDLAHAWIDAVLEVNVGTFLTEKYSYGNAVDEKANQNTGFTYGDKLVFLETPEDFNRRIEIWNEVKAAI